MPTMFKILTVAFAEEKECFLEEELNRFCLKRIIKRYKTEFFQSTKGAYWSEFLEYETVHEEIGRAVKRQHLSKLERHFFEKLREWRKQKAEENGFPVYIVCNDRQLTAIVKEIPKTLEALRNIDGFGEKKLSSYGKEIISMVKDFSDRS